MESLMEKEGLPMNQNQGFVLEFTQGRPFNLLMAAVIAVNTIYLGIETDFDDEYRSGMQIWYYLELGFTSVFLIELLLKLYAERWLFFNDRWNSFDFVLVVITCLDAFVLEQIAKESGSSIDFVSVIRVLRLLRVARIIRLLRFFRTLWLLIIGVLDAMRTLVWAWVLITIIIFTFAVILTRVLGLRHGNDNRDVKEQFGKVEGSMFTMFQVLTLEGWPSIARNAIEYEPWIWIMFVVFLLMTTFSIMNVIVAVIVEGTLEQANDRQAETRKRQQAEMQKAGGKVIEMFCATDANGDGQVTKEEFLASMKRQDVLTYLSEVGIDVRQASNLFDILDYDDSGSLDAEEFSRGVLKARGEAQAQDVLAVQCELWRYELKIKEELQNLCIRVNCNMEKVDDEIDRLRLDISKLDGLAEDPNSEVQPGAASSDATVVRPASLNGSASKLMLG